MEYDHCCIFWPPFWCFALHMLFKICIFCAYLLEKILQPGFWYKLKKNSFLHNRTAPTQNTDHPRVETNTQNKPQNQQAKIPHRALISFHITFNLSSYCFYYICKIFKLITFLVLVSIKTSKSPYLWLKEECL